MPPADHGHLLADGYNLAHAWPEVRALLPYALDAAVEQVVQRLRPVHDQLGWHLTVVFDGRADRMTIEHPAGSETLTVVFSSRGTTADGVIEQLLARTPSTAGWKVASDDRALVQSAVAYGAETISADETREWIRRIEGEASSWIDRHRSRNDAAWRNGGKG